MQSLETLLLDRGHPWVAEALAGQAAPSDEDTADSEQELPREAAEAGEWTAEDHDHWTDGAAPDAPAHTHAESTTAEAVGAPARPLHTGEPAEGEDELDVRPAGPSALNGTTGVYAGGDHGAYRRPAYEPARVDHGAHAAYDDDEDQY
jgi:hypothetical protein